MTVRDAIQYLLLNADLDDELVIDDPNDGSDLNVRLCVKRTDRGVAYFDVVDCYGDSRIK